MDRHFSDLYKGNRHYLWTRQTILARWWVEDGTAAFRVVDQSTRRLLCRRFASLRLQNVTSYRVVPELTKGEASNLRRL